MYFAVVTISKIVKRLKHAKRSVKNVLLQLAGFGAVFADF